MTGAETAAIAKSWLGTPYRHQASAKGRGTDCLGLLRGVWREAVGPEPVSLPPYTPRWHEGEGEPLLDAARRFLLPATGEEPQAGDVLIFGMHARAPAKHCGIYLGQDRFIHAYDRHAVTITRYAPWWQRRLAGRFVLTGSEKETGHE